MKNVVPLGIVGILVLSGLGAAAVSQTAPQPLMKTETISFSQPTIENSKGCALVSIDNTNAWLRKNDMPFLPAQVTTYIFPFGTKIQGVDVTFSAPQSFTLEQDIVRCPAPVTEVNGATMVADEPYQSLVSPYPENLFDYHMGAGISDGKHVLFLSIRSFPVQYEPKENTILYRGTASLSVTYELPTAEQITPEVYKLIIIAPQEFSAALQPLVNHKISKGITTKLVTMDDITQSVYFPLNGRDSAEQLKYFIKNAYDQWGTTYVLLVGGRYGGILKEKWWVPVRYTNLDDGANWEGGYLSDLYFADLYDTSGNFSSWDSNGNGIFAEWNNNGKDILEMYPEVYLGRLPCKTVNEVKTMVTKIMTYENASNTAEWFHTVVVVGGDSAPAENDSWYEGEEENKLALSYMDGFDGTKLWASNGNLTGPQDVIKAVSKGCGFLFFDGHGNPITWATHPPKNESAWITGLQVKDMPKLTNGAKLPVCVCGGCHNAQFNTSLMNFFKGIIKERLKYFQWTFFLNEWSPACWAWKLMSVKNGGSIATMAYSGLDWFAEGDYNNDSIPDCVQFFSGYANTQFFKNYGVNHLMNLSQAHTQALIDYVTLYPPMNEKIDCKTVQEFVLLGDPSLRIGGYS